MKFPRSIIKFAVAVWATLLLGVFAQPVAATTAPQQEMRISFSAAEPVTGGSVQAACNRYTRTQVCEKATLTVTLLRNRVPVGRLTATITQSIVFSMKSKTFREQMIIKVNRITGEAFGIRETFSVRCGGSCKASNKFPKGRLLNLGATIKGKITYTDNVKVKKVHYTANQYTLVTTKAGFPPGAVSWRSIGYRCDNMFSLFKKYVPGCVIPKAAATMTTMAGLKEISKNIRKAQAGKGHYGQPGKGHPLHRLTDVKKQRANREAVCGKKVVGTPPKGKECDEYPFAATKEGGTAVSKANRSVAWVPKGEQRSQGGRIADFWRSFRVLNGEAFYVKV